MRDDQFDARPIPDRQPDTTYEFRSYRPSLFRLLQYVSVVLLLCFAAWIVLTMVTTFDPRVVVVLAVAIGLAVGLPIVRLYYNAERKNRQATLRRIKTSR